MVGAHWKKDPLTYKKLLMALTYLKNCQLLRTFGLQHLFIDNINMKIKKVLKEKWEGTGNNWHE